MDFIVADLEWNGAYTAKAHGYFNEIIEIGAVKLDDRMEPTDSFHAVVRPVVSTKLSTIVKDLTSITPEELETGMPFSQAVSRMRKWAGGDSVLLTWSTTDLLVLMENCRYFLGTEKIPFMSRYADLQAYCQWRTGVGSSQQIGLSKACELLGIPEDGMDLHRALDDSRLTAEVLRHVYEPDSFGEWMKPADEKFYERLNFKTTIINDIESPLIKRSDLLFRCDSCGRNLKRAGEWRFRNRAFCADFACRGCGKEYVGRVQCKLKYEGVETKRRLSERVKPSKEEAVPAEEKVPIQEKG